MQPSIQLSFRAGVALARSKVPQCRSTGTLKSASARTHLSSLARNRFRFPAEWEHQSQTITVWPDWGSIEDDELLVAARSEVSAISNAIALFQDVTMYTKPTSVKAAKESVSPKVKVVGLDVNELWVRDTGPIIVQDMTTQKQAAIGLNYNYWGGKFAPLGDENAASLIASNLGIQYFSASLQAEGGGIDVDGEGTLLATESAIINTNRNTKSRREIEEGLAEAFGIEKFIWLPGIKGFDVTDYHIDAFARFVSPGVVLLAKPPSGAVAVVKDAYLEAREILSGEKDAKGRQLQIEEVAEPEISQIPGANDESMVASYVNFLFVNGGIIMPRFGVGEIDSSTVNSFQRLFPSRKIVQIHLNALPNLGGGIHCATQQIPSLA